MEQALAADIRCAWLFMEPPSLGRLQFSDLQDVQRRFSFPSDYEFISVFFFCWFETAWVVLDSVARKTLTCSLYFSLMKLQILVTASGSA